MPSAVAVPGVNDIATTHPHLVSEWFDFARDVRYVKASSKFKATWKCIQKTITKIKQKIAQS